MASRFYTTPLKALSNQKFGDLVAKHGADRVGLLTGDNTINSEAPVVVMTTEVLRNMLYERSDTLDGLVSVVMDEVHYLQDPYRGAVWEEVLIHLPLSVSVVCLSATISNAEEFGEWIGTLRGETQVIIEERRPVPLEHHYLIGHRLHPMHVEQDGVPIPNPYVISLDQNELRTKTYYRRSSGYPQDQRISRPREGHRRVYVPRRSEVVDVLEEHGMLPAIYFVFSRAGCDRSVRWIREAGISLTTRAEADHIRERAETRAAWIDEEDLVSLGFYDFLDGLTAGVAAHHAGMLPVFKETVEELFEAGLVKVVFATETLSLGINMPAQDRGDRGPVEVPRRAARAAHARRVHPAHRTRGAPWHRRGRPRGRAVPEAGRLRARGHARATPHLRPRLVVPALVQHGREPRPQLHGGAGASSAEQLLRAVPRRPQGGRARA